MSAFATQKCCRRDKKETLSAEYLEARAAEMGPETHDEKGCLEERQPVSDLGARRSSEME